MNRTHALEQYSTIDTLYVDKKLLTFLNIFWIGFTTYTVAYSLYASGSSSSMYRVEALGLILMLVGGVGVIHWRIENQYLRVIYIIYSGWLAIIIARGISFNYNFLFNSLFDAWYGILPYFVPIVLLFPRNVFHLKKIFTVILIIGIAYLACVVKYRGQLEDISDDGHGQDLLEILSKTLAVPSGFLVLTYVYQSKGRRLLAFTIILICLLLALIRARRSIAFMEVTYLLGFYAMYLIYNKIKFAAVILSLFVVGLVSFGGFVLYQQQKHGAFNLITNRIDEDTRSTVEECFYDDLRSKEWIIGKGMRGTYFCPAVDENSNDYTGGYRTMIETDYLNIILKGGLVSIVLLLLILIPAMVKGLFRSKNLLSKACAIWILLWLVDLYPATVNTFTMNYLLVWIAVGICYTKSIRNIPDSDIKEMLLMKV